MEEVEKNCSTCKYHNLPASAIPCDDCTMSNSNWEPADELAERIEHYSQTAKADAGKPQLTLVPRRIIWDIAKVREYGNKKYHDPENWRTVEPQRYRDAAFRHFLAYLDDPDGVDEESGIRHLHHLACNIAFLCEMEDTE